MVEYSVVELSEAETRLIGAYYRFEDIKVPLYEKAKPVCAVEEESVSAYRLRYTVQQCVHAHFIGRVKRAEVGVDVLPKRKELRA